MIFIFFAIFENTDIIGNIPFRVNNVIFTISPTNVTVIDTWISPAFFGSCIFFLCIVKLGN